MFCYYFLILIDFLLFFLFFFFFNDTATTEIYTLSLHDALPISLRLVTVPGVSHQPQVGSGDRNRDRERSEEHTSELQSHVNLVCRLLLEKQKKKENRHFLLKKKINIDKIIQ